MYIVFEGPEGCGKSSTSEIIYENLKKQGIKVIHTRHPGATKLGQEIRSLTKHRHDIEIDPFTEQLLMACDNSAFIHGVLIPALEDDTIVIADRCNFISGFPYGMANGNPLETIENQHKVLMDVWRMIDHLLIFDLPFEMAQERLNKRQDEQGDDGIEGQICKFESRGDSFSRKVSDLYKEMIMTEGSETDLNYVIDGVYAENIKVIDASQSQDKVVKDCEEYIMSLLVEEEDESNSAFMKSMRLKQAFGDGRD
jgi:dTMP kinase